MTKTCKMLCFCSFTWRSLRTFQSRMYLTSAVYLNKFQSKHFLYLIGGKTCWYEREKEKVSLVWEAHFKDIDRNRRSQRKLCVFCPIIPSSRVLFFLFYMIFGPNSSTRILFFYRNFFPAGREMSNEFEGLAFLSIPKWHGETTECRVTSSSVKRAACPGNLLHSWFGGQDEKQSLISTPAEITDNLHVSLN